MFEKLVNFIQGVKAVQNRAKLKMILNVIIRLIDAIDGEQDFFPKVKK